jgi:hypothetical protein
MRDEDVEGLDFSGRMDLISVSFLLSSRFTGLRRLCNLV